ASVQWRVVDYWGREVAKGQTSVTLTDRVAKVPLRLFAERLGLFRVLLTLGPATSEMTYSVLPPNTHPDSLYPRGSLGGDQVFSAPHPLATPNRANFNWAIRKFLGRWYIVEPQEGKLKFDAEAVAAARRTKMLLLLQPVNIDWGCQEWLKP